MKKWMFLVFFFLLTGCGFKDPGLAKFDVTYTSSQNCWTCSLYITCFNAMGGLVDKFVQEFSGYAIKLLAIGLLFWIVVFVLRTFSSAQHPDFKKFWPAMTLTFGKAILVAVLLSSNGTPFKKFINATLAPLVQVILSFGNTVFFQSLTPEMTDPSSKNPLLLGREEFVFAQVPGAGDMGDYLFFTKALATGVTELIFRFNNLLASGWELARGYVTSANPAEWLVGILVGGITFSLVVTIPLMFIDGFIKVGGILLLAPFLLVAWVFGETKKFTTKALNIIISSVVQLFLTCVVLGIFGVILMSWYDPTSKAEMAKIMTGVDFSREGLGNMVTAMTRLMEGVLSQPLLLLLSFLFMQQTLKNIPKLSKYFGGDGTESAISSVLMQGMRTGADAIRVIKAGGNPLGVLFGALGGAPAPTSEASEPDPGMANQNRPSGNNGGASP